MSNVRLPHWLAIALGLAVIVLTWLTQQSAAGTLSLPAWATMACGALLPILAMLAPSVTPSTNVKAALASGHGCPCGLMPRDVRCPCRDVQADAVSKVASKLAPLACLCLLLAAPLMACHETPQAAIAQTIDLTNAVCSVAPDAPVDGPLVDIVCQVVQGTEGVVSVVINALDADAGTTTAMTVPVRTLTITMTRAQAPAFLAAHKGAAPAPGAGRPASTAR